MAVSLKLGPAMQHFAETIEQQRVKLASLEDALAAANAEASRTDAEAGPVARQLLQTEVGPESATNFPLIKQAIIFRHKVRALIKSLPCFVLSRWLFALN